MNAGAKRNLAIGTAFLTFSVVQPAYAETFECPFEGHPAILDMTYQQERLTIDGQMTALYDSNTYWRADTGTHGYTFSFEEDSGKVLTATVVIDEESGKHIFTGSATCTRRAR